MPVKVRCTGCEKVLTAPDSARGKAIRCPACETKVRVPAETVKKKKSKEPDPADSEDAIASLDLRHMEDRPARICPKCGFDMQYLDEEDAECPKCGYDASMGGLGERAQKKRLKGPDPDKFYSGLWGANWKFVSKNQILAWRTIIYLLIASSLMFLCLFLYLYIPMWPPRVFFALCAFVAGMMIPGWLWFLDQELAVASLQRKDKLKRINFDFFLCSALGVKFLAWNAVFALPVIAIPVLIGWVLTSMGGAPDYVMWICVALGYFPVLAMMPICIGHFIMPVQMPGWMFWKVVPAWIRTLKPTLLWVALTLSLNLPVIGCLAAIGVVYGPSIQNLVADMEENAAIARVKRAYENSSEKEKQAFADNPMVEQEYLPITYSTLLVPGVLWGLACVFVGFPALYSCRVNGQFLYFFREQLDLILLAKEYKYVSKEKTDEDEDDKPKTMGKIAVEALITAAICNLLGLVGGMVYGSLNQNVGMFVGLLVGTYAGAAFAMLVGSLMLLTAAFQESPLWGIAVLFGQGIGALVFVIMHFREAAQGFFTWLFGFLIFSIILMAAAAGFIQMSHLGFGGGDEAAQVAPFEEDMGGEAAPAGAEGQPVPEAP